MIRILDFVSSFLFFLFHGFIWLAGFLFFVLQRDVLFQVVLAGEVLHADDADRPELGNLGLMAYVGVIDAALLVVIGLEVRQNKF